MPLATQPGAKTRSTRLSQLGDDALLAAYRSAGDRAAREKLVERYMPFARKLALRYNYTTEPLDDLVQVACVGLLKAVDRFDPERGTRFTSFAAPTILGELKRHFRDKGWGVHVPRDLQEHAVAMGIAKQRLSQSMGRSPTVQELAEALGWPVELVLEAMEVVHGYDTASLDAPVSRGDGDESAAMIERLGSDDPGYELAETREAIARSWTELSELEQQVVTLRLQNDMTQREIGRRVGYSQMHVSRVLRRSMLRLGASLQADPAPHGDQGPRTDRRERLEPSAARA